jgi:hypothetical protein
MQKTGCTHIASILDTLFDGQTIGKHNRASEQDIQSEVFFLSSIRNPWEWYLSLWTFGVQGNGGLRNRLTKRSIRKSIKTALKNPARNFMIPFIEPFRNTKQWESVYDSSDNITSFRSWLKLIHAPNNSTLLGEEYGNTVITQFAGLMTHRYLFLCCKGLDKLKSTTTVENHEGLVSFDQKNCYIDFFVRQEHLEEDLCLGLDKIRKLSDEEKMMVFIKKKTNTSKRALTISDYYDQSSIDLIRGREKLIIEKFGYTPPMV